VYGTNTENIVIYITGVDFSAFYPSVYSCIPNEMTEYTGNKMLMPGNFKEYITDKTENIEYDLCEERVVCSNIKRRYSRRTVK
jgi:hypothetical protein